MSGKTLLHRLAIGIPLAWSTVSITGAGETPASRYLADPTRSRESLAERYESRFSREQWNLSEAEWEPVWATVWRMGTVPCVVEEGSSITDVKLTPFAQVLVTLTKQEHTQLIWEARY